MVLSYKQIDDFAQNIVDKAYPSDNCFPTSINIENFLKEAFNVDVEYFTLSTDCHQIVSINLSFRKNGKIQYRIAN